jgi:hypothetical protein
MSDFTVRADAVNVEQIMEQIRERIRTKRGVDYTEEQIRELAAVKLEKFLDPKIVRSDLLQQFQRSQAEQPVPTSFTFEDSTLFDSPRPLVRRLRKLLRPLLKLFFNPDPLIQALHIQAHLNEIRPRADHLYYELFHNLVIETTRLTIEVKNLKMQIESLTGRLEFNERRARALESAVVYRSTGDEPDRRVNRPPSLIGSGAPVVPVVGSSVGLSTDPSTAGQSDPTGSGQEGPGQRSRRRRRRRGRRGNVPAATLMGAAAGTNQPEHPAGDVHDAAAETDASQPTETQGSDPDQ